MIKTTLAIAAIAALAPAGAIAGPYVNIEANSGFYGADYLGTATDFHVGIEGPLGESASWYLQGGPAILSPDGGEAETIITAKGGGSVDLTEKLSVYGEISFASGVDDPKNSYGTKVGAKYKF